MLRKLYTLFAPSPKDESPKLQILLLHQNLPLSPEEIVHLKADLYQTIRKHLDGETEPNIIEHRDIS